MSEDKRKIGTIDLTPTWEETLPLLLQGLRSENPDQASIALQEIARMARLADAYVASSKQDG